MAKPQDVTWCPDGYAFRLKSGLYIRCEDFDAYHFAEYHQKSTENLTFKGLNDGKSNQSED